MTELLTPYTPPALVPYLPLLLVWGWVTIPAVVLSWVWVFPKAGQPWWAAVVPGYNVYVLVVRVARLSLLWFVLMFTPIVQVIAVFLVNVEVAKRFGRSDAFGLGLTVLGFVFYPVLALGDARYRR